AALSTSLRVELRNWAATTRRKVPESARTLETPAHRVQIVGDMDQPLRGGQKAGRHVAEMPVLRVQPEAGLRGIAADQRIEAAEDAHQEERVAALGRVGIGAALVGEGARDA